MKTLFLFEVIPEDTFFFELDGNYSHLNGVYVNSTVSNEKAMTELNDLVYHPTTGEKIVKTLDIPTKDFDVFVKCGFYL